MKFAKLFVAMQVLGVLFPAQAESDFSAGPLGLLSASARLNFQVTVPKLVYLRVGSGTNFVANNTVDQIDFNVPVDSVGNGAPVNGESGSGPAAVVAQVLSNGNSVTLTANGTAGGLSSGAQSIPWSQIFATSSSGTLPHPAIGDGTAGAGTMLVAAAGIVDRTSNWSFSYSNNVSRAAGTYRGQVTYTATTP